MSEFDMHPGQRRNITDHIFPDDATGATEEDLNAVVADWKSRDKKDRNVEAKIFVAQRIVRVEFLDEKRKHMDHIDFTFEEYAHICGFKEPVRVMVEEKGHASTEELELEEWNKAIDLLAARGQNPRR